MNAWEWRIALLKLEPVVNLVSTLTFGALWARFDFEDSLGMVGRQHKMPTFMLALNGISA